MSRVKRPSLPPSPSTPRDSVADYVAQWATERPDLDAAPLLVIGRINRLDALLDDLLRPTFATAGLASGDFDVLAALRRAGPPYTLGSTTLATHMLVTNGAATKRADRLEAQGLVTRTVSPTDGRGRDISLTDRGVALVDRLIDDHLANERDLLAALPASDQTLMANLLSRFLHIVEERHASHAVSTAKR
jgi:DNA-binding MarR family transcriptional regulator